MLSESSTYKQRSCHFYNICLVAIVIDLLRSTKSLKQGHNLKLSWVKLIKIPLSHLFTFLSYISLSIDHLHIKFFDKTWPVNLTSNSLTKGLKQERLKKLLSSSLYMFETTRALQNLVLTSNKIKFDHQIAIVFNQLNTINVSQQGPQP